MNKVAWRNLHVRRLGHVNPGWGLMRNRRAVYVCAFGRGIAIRWCERDLKCTLLNRRQLHRSIRNWNSRGTTVYHKWENCWCGAQVLAEGSEDEVVFVCQEFRARHRHTNLKEIL